MSLFDQVGDKFFNPFCCKNREVYFECICRLIEVSKELPVLYETDARNTIILYLQNCQYSLEEEDIGEQVGNDRTPQENAAAILRYFRACSWVSAAEIGRSGDNIAAVSPYCRKVIEAICKIFDTNANGAITNHIFSMYEILKAASTKDNVRTQRPYVNILLPLVDHETELKDELQDLRDSIKEIMHLVTKISEPNSFGQFLLKNTVLEQFFNDYFFLKRSGSIPKYINDIRTYLRNLRDSSLYEKIVEDYLQSEHRGARAFEKTDAKDVADARERVERLFEGLDSFITLEYDQQIAHIDNQINRYYGLYSTRMMMVLSDNIDLEHVLNHLLLYLKDLPEEEKDAVLQRLGQTQRLMRFDYIGKRSLERRKKPMPHTGNARLLEEDISPEELRQMTDDLLSSTPDRYSMDNVQAYLDEMLEHRDKISVEECGIETRDDATMVAASMIYSGTVGFPYEVEMKDGLVETEVAQISNVSIRRAKR